MATIIAKALGISPDDLHPARWRLWINPWMVVTGLVVILLLVPVLYIVGSMFDASMDVWKHTATVLMPRYLRDTVILLLSVGLISLVIGVGAAWIVTAYEFPGRRLLAWGLILPLALPSYIVGFTYAGIFDYTGTVQQVLRDLAGPEARLPFSVKNIWGVIFVLSVTLYPYVYLISRASFLRQGGAVLEVSRLMGRSSLHGLLRVVLPLAWPAIFGGLMLVLMEVLNDYGVADHYGIDTVTVGIFRAWSGMWDPSTAFSFSACMLLIVLGILAFERFIGRRLRHKTAAAAYRPVQPIQLTRGRAALAIGLCALPLLAGFIIPVAQLLYWAAVTWRDVVDREFFRLIWNSLYLAALVTCFTVIIAVFIVYTSRLYRNPLSQSYTRLAVLSYSLPGAILGVGVFFLVMGTDRAIVTFLHEHFGRQMRPLLNATLFAVTYGCVVRFMAVGINPLEAGFERVCGRYDEASRILGASPWRTLIRVDLPLLKGTLAAAAILVFVDTMKELPLTLMLRPPGGNDTLAIKAYAMAKDELVPESSIASLIILAAGLIPVTLMNKLMVRTDS